MALVDPFVPRLSSTWQQPGHTSAQPLKSVRQPQLVKYRPMVGSFKPVPTARPVSQPTPIRSGQLPSQQKVVPVVPSPPAQIPAPKAVSSPVTSGSAAVRLPDTKKRFIAPVRRTNKLKAFAQTTAILIWALALGIGIYSQVIGELAITAYALTVLIFRLSSQTSFALALCAFVGIVVAQVLKPETNIAANFAVYAFLLLIVGSVSLWLEVRQRNRWNRRPKTR